MQLKIRMIYPKRHRYQIKSNAGNQTRAQSKTYSIIFVILMRTNNSTSDEIQTSEPRSHAWFQQTASR
ncbi:hypothetical protein BDA96_06G019800 [Sorghum bicolor]|uniref:Uncharacterized protein n=2 Tax=Sorghum bicolor TaxID=4558 RepID=A0A921UB10_SORBI|nr:hypothetical protein BDA96_06G019800 [Sorghum bicolor]KXG25828.1 hypothetical protein SORBI_3006G018500 [Sorghum bicolor]